MLLTYIQKFTLMKLISIKVKPGMIFKRRQCMGASKYETGEQLLEVGVIGVKDMTLESALAKAMFLLDKYSGNRKSFVEEFLTIRAGEFTN